jgi:hypothetical protein
MSMAIWPVDHVVTRDSLVFLSICYRTRLPEFCAITLAYFHTGGLAFLMHRLSLNFADSMNMMDFAFSWPEPLALLLRRIGPKGGREI